MDSLRAEINGVIHPGMAPTLAEASRSATSALGVAGFDSAHRAGRQLSRDAAVRLALRDATAPAPALEPNASVLSRRETDVARLVTVGLTNKEIGAQLFISERTVESHVRNILTKLGFTSRTQVASWNASRER